MTTTQQTPMAVPARSYWQLLSRYIAPHRGLVVILALLLFGGIGLQLLAPWLAGQFVNGVKDAAADPDGSLDGGLIPLAIAFFAAGIVVQLLSVASSHLGAHVAWMATNTLREDALAHCLALDMSFHHRHSPGVMVERIDGDVRELNNFFTEFGLRVLGNLLLILGVLVVILIIDWRVGLVFVAFSGLALFVFYQVRNTASPFWARSREANATLYGEVEERFGGLADLRVNGARSYAMRRFTELVRDEFHRTRSAVTVSVAILQGSGLVMKMGGIVILATSAALFLNGRMELGTVVTMSLYATIISVPLAQIVDQIDDLQRATASIARVRELLATERSILPGPGAGLAAGPLSVEFDSVGFSYPKSEDEVGTQVLHDVSFSLAPGETLGVIGRTGAGKSTIVRLLLRLYDPTSGRVLVGGAELPEATVAELRHHIGVVTQEVQLFHATVRDNLTLFDESVPDETLVSLIHEVGLGAWFARQPDGLDTVLASGGSGLSAGEGQLLGMIRIFVTDPGVVILDEPTSRLDPETEALLDAALDRLLANRTAVIVAHRLATLHRVDTLMVVDGGRIVEYGPEEVLAADPDSAYRRGLELGTLEVVAPVAGGQA